MEVFKTSIKLLLFFMFLWLFFALSGLDSVWGGSFVKEFLQTFCPSGEGLRELLKRISISGSIVGFLCAFMIYFYQNTDLDRSLKKQAKTINEALVGQTHRIDPIEAYESLVYLQKKENIKEILFVSNLSAIPLFWYDKDKARDMANLFIDISKKGRVFIYGPDDEQFKKHCEMVANHSLEFISRSPSIKKWRNSTLSEMDCVGEREEAGILHDEKKKSIYLCLMENKIKKDYKNLLNLFRSEDEITYVDMKTTSVSVNVCYTRLKRENKLGSKSEMIMFANKGFDIDKPLEVDSILKNSTKNVAQDIFEEPVIYKTTHGFNVKAVVENLTLC